MGTLYKKEIDKKPNIIFIILDQQRADTIHALGNDNIITPNIDNLVKEGVSFTNCFSTAPSCVPSRSSLFKARFPHKTGITDNSVHWQSTWLQNFKKHGYYIANVGKMHTVPHDSPSDFDFRFIVEDKDRLRKPGSYQDEWNQFLISNNLKRPTRVTYKNNHPEYNTALGAYEWSMDESLHPDKFISQKAINFIQNYSSNSPLFLEIGFVGPHPPYDPPKRYLDLYKNTNFNPPIRNQNELNEQPEVQKQYRQEMIHGNHDAVKWREDPSYEMINRLRKHYAANITMIDEEIGRIIKALKNKGLYDDSIIILTSDHGDLLGDHFHIQKWTMYDQAMKVPMLIYYPKKLPKGIIRDKLLHHMDIIPVIFELADISPLENSDAISAMPMILENKSIRDEVIGIHGRCNMLPNTDFVRMLRTNEFKIVCYDGFSDGELYDLHNDPDELKNLWNIKKYNKIKKDLLKRLYARFNLQSKMDT